MTGATTGATSFFEVSPAVAADGSLRQQVRGLAPCGGPWSPDAMHGGPPSALLVRACEQVAGVVAATDPGLPTAPATPTVGGLVAVRTAIDFLSAVPLGDLEVVARLVRPGRRVALAEASLLASGREVLTARTWLLARADPPVTLPDGVAEPGVTLPEPDLCPPPAGDRWDFPYGRAVDWRVVAGMAAGTTGGYGPGDATVWARGRLPLVAGETPSGLQRAVLVADSSSGVSAGLDWDRWLFVNVDLTVHLARPLAGEWVCLDAHSRYAGSGTGLARSTLHDVEGVVGSSAQSLVVSPR